MAELRDTQRIVHQLAKKNGWWVDAEFRIIPEKLALIHAEISEALEEYRDGKMELYHDANGKPEGFGVELADAVIRIMDLSEWLGIDLAELIEQKHTYNQTRSYRHGSKLA